MRNRHARKERIRITETILSGRYRVIETLGKGATSTVYLAEHLRLKSKRAIKCLPKDRQESSSFSLEASLPTEAELLKNLTHPGIPLIYDIDEDEKFYYIIEEYIQGESLDQIMVHQENISQELIVKVGIQLCDILDYLHHTAPYPILYQDLKPEHIIVCGNQVKLIDFGIAAFFTGSGKNFQLYGTDGYVAPEVLSGAPVSPAADIYSLGRVLLTLAFHARIQCSAKLLHALKKAAAVPPAARFETVSDVKAALLAADYDLACQSNPHLIKNIAVLGSRPGAGATHFSVSLVCTLNKMGHAASCLAADGSLLFGDMQKVNRHLTEKDGIFHYHFFSGMPVYGEGLYTLPVPSGILVKDYGVQMPFEPDTEEMVFYVFSGSDWELQNSIAAAKSLLFYPKTVFICNYGNQKAAKYFARQLDRPVYCFPLDADAFTVTPEKERLIQSIFPRKGGKKQFFSRKRERKREP